MIKDYCFGGVNNMKAEQTDSLTGIILLTSISIVAFSLFSRDTQILIFAIPIIYGLIIAVSRKNNKDIDDSIRSIGLGESNTKTAIPIGIAVGLLVFIFGNLVISLTSRVTASSIPTFAISLSGASFIPANVFLGVNILTQWLIVSPSEEIGFRFLCPFIYNSFIKIAPVAMILATITWVGIHIPAYIMQAVPLSMYFVLFFVGLISIGLIYYTNGLTASVVMHATFNTLVLAIGGVLNIYVYFILIIIALSLILLYLSGGDRRAKTQTEFNL